MSTIMSEHINNRSESPNAETRALFSCKICFEPYSKCYRCPVSLNCGHTFCLVCIRKLGLNKSTIQCGICRKNTYSNYKRLGKNIVLTELLEWMNILIDDSERKPTPEEEVNNEEAEQEWPGAQHFIGPANLEEFYEDLQTFDALVHNWPTYGSLQRQLDKRVQNLRCDMTSVEAQLRQAGDSYRDILAKLEELRSDINNQVAAYQLEQQEGPDGQLDPGWTNFNGGWSRGGDGLASPPPVVLPMPISDESDRESTSRARRTNTAWNYNNNNRRRPRPQRPQYQVLVLSDHPISCHPLPPPQPEDDWGSSSGWSDSEANDKTSDVMPEMPEQEQKSKDEIQPNNQNHSNLVEMVTNQEIQQQSSNNKHSNNSHLPQRPQRQPSRYYQQHNNWNSNWNSNNNWNNNNSWNNSNNNWHSGNNWNSNNNNNWRHGSNWHSSNNWHHYNKQQNSGINESYGNRQFIYHNPNGRITISDEF